MGFLKDIRLKGKEFSNVIKQGERIETYLFRCFLLRESDQATKKFGLIISKKIGNAVVRNRIKRLLREAYRNRYEKIAKGTKIVIQAKRVLRERCNLLKLKDVEDELKGLWKRIALERF